MYGTFESSVYFRFTDVSREPRLTNHHDEMRSNLGSSPRVGKRERAKSGPRPAGTDAGYTIFSFFPIWGSAAVVRNTQDAQRSSVKKTVFI